MILPGRDASPYEYEIELEVCDMHFMKSNIELLQNVMRRFTQNIASLSHLMSAVTRDIDNAANQQKQAEEAREIQLKQLAVAAAE